MGARPVGGAANGGRARRAAGGAPGPSRTCARRTCARRTCARRTCARRTCARRTCARRTCARRTCARRTCARRTCARRTCARRTSAVRACSGAPAGWTVGAPPARADPGGSGPRWAAARAEPTRSARVLVPRFSAPRDAAFGPFWRLGWTGPVAPSFWASRSGRADGSSAAAPSSRDAVNVAVTASPLQADRSPAGAFPAPHVPTGRSRRGRRAAHRPQDADVHGATRPALAELPYLRGTDGDRAKNQGAVDAVREKEGAREWLPRAAVHLLERSFWTQRWEGLQRGRLSGSPGWLTAAELRQRQRHTRGTCRLEA
ncbi:uncharacterized protein LOC122899306 [Neovison vison]|uniref:uncharacterized protein LOC122899306 n=1 Tax=Neovison vison TaxID=452646 RepID=UPI001CEFE3E1|nr:uncharacterized protein LOC122899306 [Neogale vison]